MINLKDWFKSKGCIENLNPEIAEFKKKKIALNKNLKEYFAKD